MLKLFRKNSPDLSDEELVQQYQRSGDLEQLGVLYERYIELVYGTCLKFFKEPAMAEDAVMGIFETLVEKVKTHEIRQFRPWLHVVSKNHCLMALRKKNLTVSYDDLTPSAKLESVHSADSMHPLDTFEENPEEAALKDCVERLSENQKKCIEQFYFDGKSYQEIADESGEALGTVRSNIQNGRRNLRICLEKKLSATGEKTVSKK